MRAGSGSDRGLGDRLPLRVLRGRSREWEGALAQAEFQKEGPTASDAPKKPNCRKMEKVSGS